MTDFERFKIRAKDAARGQWPLIIPAITTCDGSRLNGKHGPCLKCGGTDRFRALNTFPEDGAVYCNGCFSERNGDGFAAIQWLMGWTFPEAVRAVAKFLGIPEDDHGNGHAHSNGHANGHVHVVASTLPPTVATAIPPAESNGPPPTKPPVDELAKKFRIRWGSGTEIGRQKIATEIQAFATAKPPVTVEAIAAAGGRLVNWPNSDQHGFGCIAFPSYAYEGEEPAAWLLRRIDGEEFEAFGNLEKRKTHTLGIKGKSKGWLIVGGFERLRRARYVLKVEGELDAVSIHPYLPDDWCVVTNSCGAKSVPDNLEIFAGKINYVLGDADVPGQDGAIRFAVAFLGVAESVKLGALPYDVEPDHGKDVRDYLNDGHTFEELRAMLEATPTFVKPEKPPKTSKKKDHLEKRAERRRNKPPVDPFLDVFEPQGRTDTANSRRLIKAYGLRIIYCHEWKKWLSWEATHWQIDKTGTMDRFGKEIADSVWVEVGEDPSVEEAVAFGVKASSSGGIAAMLRLAQSAVPILPSDLDSNPWLFNCANGTIDLRTGDLRPHQKSDFFTKICPTAFNPEATSYEFDRFMESIFDNQTIIDFVQRLAGYCLTGSVAEQILSVFWGKGSNGKSTYLNALQYVLGSDYAAAAPPSLLIEKKQETHPTELADLFGKRLVIASETNHGARLAESTVKQLTGGDVISARRMREDFWTFKPTHKLILCTNHKPAVKGTDHAIWRRLVLVPFNRIFWNPDKGESGPPELKQDKSLPRKLEAEAEGILAWMVRGCLEWQSGGLQIPDDVRAATDEYRSQSDVVGNFVAQCCTVSNNPNCREKFSKLYERFEKWCNDNGDKLPSKKFTGEYLRENGFEAKQSGVVWYIGIMLKPFEPECSDSKNPESV